MSYSGTIISAGADDTANVKQLQEASKELTKMLDGIEKKLAALSLKAISAAFKTVSDSFDDSFKSMERSVTRGSQTIINAMNEARASVNKPDLNASIVALGVLFENALGGIAQLAVPVAQNLELIASAAVGIGAALATWKISETISTLQTVVSLTDPIKLTMLGVAALVGIVGTLISLTQASDESMADLTAAKERTAAIQEQTDAYNKRVLAAQASVEGDLAELNHTKALASELFSLMDASGKILEADQARADYLISVLNPALGTEIQMIDGQIQGHEELQAQVAKTIEMKQAELLLAAYEDQYTEAIQNRMKAYQEAGEAKAALDKAQMEYDQYEAEYMEKHARDLERINELEALQREGKTNYEEEHELEVLNIKIADAKLMELQETLAETQTAYADASHMVEEYNTTMETYESAHAALLQGNAQETIRILNERSLAYAQAAQKDGASAQEQQQALMNGYEGQLQAIQLYLQHAKEGKIQFNESELQLMMDHADDLYDQAVESGVKFVGGQMEGMEGEKKDLTGLLQGISDDLVDVAKKKVPDFELSGNHYILGLKKGIDSKKGQIFTSLHQLAAEMLATMQKDFDEHSPSRKAFKIGAFLSIGLANGVKDELDSTLEASKALAASVLPSDFGRALAGRATTFIGDMQAAVAGGVGLRAFGLAGAGFGAPALAAAAAGGGGSTVNYYSANIDAKNVREWNDVVKVFQNHRTTVRKGYAKG